MSIFSAIDYFAMLFFLLAWFSYHYAVERSKASQSSLNALMNVHRRAWMERMLEREQRIVDASLMGSLQNGTAFFASTSLIAIGGSLALLRAPDDMLVLFSFFPFGSSVTRTAWEIRVIGLAVIFVYAFFKFAWSYRLFNYAAVLMGAIPLASQRDKVEAQSAAQRAAEMNVVAGRHFNRGQRAFFFALAYLGWFIGSYVFIISTSAVLIVMWRRQFASDACKVIS